MIGHVSGVASPHKQCMSCGAIYSGKFLVSTATQVNHSCVHQHQGPWANVHQSPHSPLSPVHPVNPMHSPHVHQSPHHSNVYTQNGRVHRNVSPNGHVQNGYQSTYFAYPHQHPPNGHPNGLPNGYVHHNGYGHHFQQKSSSFKPTGSPKSALNVESKSREQLSMDFDLDSVEPTLLEAFKAEVNGYNTEVELTFGSNLNFTQKLAVFVTSIKAHKMTNLITQVLSWKQDIILSETVTTDKEQRQQKISNDNHQIDEKPKYVRSVLQLIYHVFLNTIYCDPQYHAFYEQYYETNGKQSESPNNKQNDSPKKKSGPHQEVDPFFQCFYECSTLYAHSMVTKERPTMELREYLELITGNIVNVLRLMNAVIHWTTAIKTNSIRLVLQESNIDISLYEFSQLLLTTPLETQHAVWQRIQKNEENQIADSQNLSLCIHILLCIAIKHKTSASKYPNTQNPDQIYAAFLEKIVSCLSQHFLRKSGNTADSGIIMEFGDLVEKLPLWILYCDKMLQAKANEQHNKSVPH